MCVCVFCFVFVCDCACVCVRVRASVDLVLVGTILSRGLRAMEKSAVSSQRSPQVWGQVGLGVSRSGEGPDMLLLPAPICVSSYYCVLAPALLEDRALMASR